MDPDSFPFWYKLIEVAGKGLGDPCHEPFWKFFVPKGSLDYLEGRYSPADLTKIWNDKIEPRLEKIIMDPEMRKRFRLPRESTLSTERTEVGSVRCAGASERARAKLAKYRIGDQPQLLEDKRPDWVGRNWGLPQPEGSEDTGGSRPAIVRLL